MSELRFGRVNIDHPTARERETGAASTAYIQLITPAGKIREVPLTPFEIVCLIEQASNHLHTIMRTAGAASASATGEGEA